MSGESADAQRDRGIADPGGQQVQRQLDPDLLHQRQDLPRRPDRVETRQAGRPLSQGLITLFYPFFCLVERSAALGQPGHPLPPAQETGQRLLSVAESRSAIHSSGRCGVPPPSARPTHGPGPCTIPSGRAGQYWNSVCMKLTRLRLLGFKSFVEPTDFLIEPGLTGVVGPNGCGKSNLVEALRWVMGETSHKSLRAAD